MDYFYICGIPFKFLYFKDNNACCQIGDSHQKIYVSSKYFDSSGHIKDANDLIWIFSKDSIMKKIRYALNEETGVSTYNKYRR